MNFTRLLQYITPHRRVLLGIMLLLLAASAVALAQPWLAGQVTGLLVDDTLDSSTLHGLLLAWAALIIIRAVLGFACQYSIGKTGEAMTAALRAQLFHHLQALPVGFNREQRSGETLALLSNDAEQISRFVTDTLVQMLPMLLTFCGAFFLMLRIDAGIALAIAALVPAFVLGLKVAGRQIRPLSRSWVDAYSDLVAFISENLSMRPAVKSFAREATEESGFLDKNQSVFELARQRLLLQAALAPAVGMFAGLGVLALLWLASWRLAAGTLQAPELVSLLLYAFLLVQPLRGLANLYGLIQVTRGCAERIEEFLAKHPEPTAPGRQVQAQGQPISFEAVSFHYRGGPTVLENLHLDIAPGETVAITGANGVGKSTLAFLLQRLADPDSGRIAIGGVDLRQFDLLNLRRQVGIVAQHTLLMNGSVADNIAYGKPEADLTEIEVAARRAHAHDFIVKLPESYATQVGDQGLRLSGGQRQRLSLARTLLVDPPILILDEATSMFDPQGEAEFIEEFRHYGSGRSVIMITHRPASLALADRVVELAGGRLRPEGASPRRGVAKR